MKHIFTPQPIRTVKFITPGVIIVILVALNGLVFLCLRFLLGVGPISNLDNFFPWGIWNAINKAGGVALAAGGFTTAAIGHIFHRDSYHNVVRPALLTAMLGYTFVGFSVFFDIGRWYYIWHPIINWNPNSALFEVGICVMIYLTVLYIEFLPVVTERFIGKVNLPGFLGGLNGLVERILRWLDKSLNTSMFVFIIMGVVLSTLHQSSLGTLTVIAGPKMHPLWQTPISPLLFFLSAIAVGFPMVIFESLIAARSFKLKPEIKVLGKLGRLLPPILGIYLIFKLVDMFIRGSFVYLAEFNTQSVMFVIELVIGVIIPLRLFLSRELLKSQIGMFIASAMVVFGVLLNRFNVFIIAYKPPYTDTTYFPSFGEISISLGIVAIIVLLYRAFVFIFPVISQPNKSKIQDNKYSVRG